MHAVNVELVTTTALFARTSKLRDQCNRTMAYFIIGKKFPPKQIMQSVIARFCNSRIICEYIYRCRSIFAYLFSYLLKILFSRHSKTL